MIDTKEGGRYRNGNGNGHGHGHGNGMEMKMQYCIVSIVLLFCLGLHKACSANIHAESGIKSKAESARPLCL